MLGNVVLALACAALLVGFGRLSPERPDRAIDQDASRSSNSSQPDPSAKSSVL
jgi:hypothetical protein